jgi:hypothetical protein
VGVGIAGQPVHSDKVAVALLQLGQVVCVPAVGGSAEKEVEAGGGYGFV